MLVARSITRFLQMAVDRCLLQFLASLDFTFCTEYRVKPLKSIDLAKQVHHYLDEKKACLGRSSSSFPRLVRVNTLIPAAIFRGFLFET